MVSLENHIFFEEQIFHLQKKYAGEKYGLQTNIKNQLSTPW